jgi:hypothetical protein
VEAVNDVAAAEAADKDPSSPALYRFPSGDVMYLEDLRELLRAELPRVVALVGEQQAGKTTLLASLYDCYCKGSFAGLRFAGSRTLTGFAKRHHLALLSSGRTVPTTPRTSRDEPVSFFHLALSPTAGGRPEHLVISDRSGEAFEAARVDTSLVSELIEVRQAQRVCFLLDGGRMLSNDQRAGYARRFRQMIRALHDNGALGPNVAIEVLTTKWDKLRTSSDSDRICGILKDYEKGLVTDFGARGLNVSCYRICALPRSDYSLGYFGLEETIRRWMMPRVAPAVVPRPSAVATRNIDRVFARWFPVTAR